MIYFLINNTFHLYEVNILCKELANHELGLIQVPYSLTPIVKHDQIKKIYTFERLSFLHEYFQNWPESFFSSLSSNKTKIKITKNNLNPRKEDVLFVFTETELLNQIIIDYYFKKKAKIYLIEDGMASALYYNMKSGPLSKKSTLFKWVVRILYRIKGYHPFVTKGYYYPMMSDSYFSGACFFYSSSIIRNIKTFTLNKNLEKIKNINFNTAIFLNEPIYRFYTDTNSYLINLEEILSALNSNFSKIHFKFHPDDKHDENLIFNIKTIINKFSNILVLETNKIIEDIVVDFNIGYAVSYFSSALRNLSFYGIEPVYIYHLINFFNDVPTAKQITLYLNTLNYNFPKSFNDIKPGYQSGLLDQINKGISIKELI